LIVAASTEILLSVGLILLIVLAILLLARRRKQDPKMALLLSLVEALPGDSEDPELAKGVGEETDGEEGHGPLGPSGFTLSA
jgi:LPXTG-motif cell wall-anchored protein